MGKKIIPVCHGVLIKEVDTGLMIKLPDGGGYDSKSWEVIEIGIDLKDKNLQIGDKVYLKPGSQFTKMSANIIRKITDGALDADLALIEERHIAFVVRNDNEKALTTN